MAEVYETPREAMLAAELREEKAKVAYLSRALNVPGELSLTEIAAVETIRPSLADTTQLMVPVVGVRGALNRFGDYHVHAIAGMQAPERFEAHYMVPGTAMIDMSYQVNRILPDLHGKFLMSLADGLRRQRT